MITTSDIVLDLVLSRGYRSLKDFALKNKMDFTRMYRSYNKNSWTRERLSKVGHCLGVDLTGLQTANKELNED